MKKLTVEWLQNNDACKSGIDWFACQTETDPGAVINKLMAEDKFDWANWLTVRLMEYKQYVSYAVFAAEQVIDIYERKYPDDKRPRQAIDAAKIYINNPSEENKKKAAAAGAAAWAAAGNAVYAAAYVAARVVYAAVWTTAAGDSARDAAEDSAWAAARDSEKNMQTKIINYGIKLLRGDK